MRTSPTEAGAVRRPPRARQRGFTLLELLIAATIAAVVMAAVYTTYAGANRSEQRIQQITEQNQRWRFFAERLQTDLKNLFALDSDFTGASDRLEMTVQTGTDLHQVRYYHVARDTGGEVRRHASSGEQSQISRVFSGAGQLRFRYHTGGQWRDMALGLPRAVECTLSGEDWRRRITVTLEVASLAG